MKHDITTDLSKLYGMLESCDTILDLLERIDFDEEVFLEDKVYQASAAFCLQRIGQLAKELSSETISSYKDKDYWRMIKGSRDIMAHQYHNVSQTMQWNTLTKDIIPLKELLLKMISDLESSD